MNTNPGMDGMLEGVIVGITNELIPFLSNEKAVATATDVFPRIIAQGFAMAGEPEPAVRWLEIAVERGFINYPFLAVHDPFFEPLRQHPRFKRLLEIVHERWDRFEA